MALSGIAHARLTYISYEFFYQLGLSEFGNFGTIEVAEGLNVRELLEMAMETDESDGMAQEAQIDEIEVHQMKTI
jgi:DNA mismatch repair protein MLH1